MEFTREQFDKAVTELTMNYGEWETDEAPVRDNYSGRGMYGRTCVGVVGGSFAIAGQFMYALAEQVYPDDLYDQKDFVLEMFDSLTTDSMGFSTIFYFPGYKIEG